MDIKLTLKLDQTVIERAKRYAATKKISLSRLIENHLNAITADKANLDLEISPFVKSMSTGVKIPSNYDYRNEVANEQYKKHQ